MKASNIIIFLIVVIVIAGIFGFAIWDMRNNNESTNVISSTSENDTIVLNDVDNLNVVDNGSNNELVITNPNNVQNQNSILYEGEWFINQDAYMSERQIDELMDKRDDHFITDEEFETQLQTLKNDEIAELEVDECSENRIKFDFELTGPAPTQRVARIEDVVVELNNNVGTFKYMDNWGTSGNGTITLKDNQIELKLETTKVNQGVLWGVEGSYMFSYRLSD